MKQIPDSTADKIAMLFSTDWFLPHWKLLGAHSNVGVSCFQQGCRAIVKQLMNGAENYYLVSFSDSRVNATRDALIELTTQCQLARETRQHLLRLCSPRAHRHGTQTAAWLFTYVLQEIKSDSKIDAAIHNVLLKADQLIVADSEVLERDCLESNSDWDSYVRQLTPDVATTLSDLVSVGLIPEAKLTFVADHLSPEQLDVLFERCSLVAEKITGLNRPADYWRDYWR